MSVAISLRSVDKVFRIPLDRTTHLKYRIVHPRSSSRYRDLPALHDLSFDVPSGQVLGIIGHNGSGKSTLLKLLARIYQPTRGTVAVHGHLAPFLELGVGFTPELTARENIYLNGSVLGLTRRQLRDRVEQIISFAGLEEFADQKIKNFSSGMEVRLAFSVAVQSNADILLLDEVLAVGDAQFQEKCFSTFDRYLSEGRTIVLVTHDLGAVREHCDRALLLDHGGLVADGEPDEVIERYREIVAKRSDESSQPGPNGLPASEPGAHQGDWQRAQRGTGEVVITTVHLCDERGRERRVFWSGGSMIIRVTISVEKPISSLVCGLVIYNDQGGAVGGTNTTMSGIHIAPPPLGANVAINFRMDRLPLLRGMYRLTVAMASGNDEPQLYDEHDQRYDFEVEDRNQAVGLVDLGGRWEVAETLPAEPARGWHA